MNNAPIFITVYDRLTHITQCINSLKNCPESLYTDIYIASDAASTEAHQSIICQVRAYLQTITGFRSVNLLIREKNIGGESNFFTGIQELFLTHEKIIVMEDDVIVGKGFLKFMNDALSIYSEDPQIVGVCGYLPPKITHPKNQPFLLNRRTPYGLGIWRAKENNLLKLSNTKNLSKILSNFKFFQKYESMSPHVARAIPLVVKGDMRPWDIIVEILMLNHNLLAIYPPVALSLSRGHDGSGLNSGNNSILQNQYVSHMNVELDKKLEHSIVDQVIAKEISKYYRVFGISYINYIIYFCYKLPGGYWIYQTMRKIIKNFRKVIR